MDQQQRHCFPLQLWYWLWINNTWNSKVVRVVVSSNKSNYWFVQCKHTDKFLLVWLFHSRLVFRAFPDSLECIARSVEAYLQQNVNDETIIIKPFTTAVIATYLDDKKIQAYCDQRWSAKGEFMENQNSQEEGTATVILVIGVDRTLDFAIYWYNGIKQVEVGIKGRYQLEHGSLFILDPSDDKPMKRNSLERYGYTFYKHSSDGVKGRELEMSIGIVFLTTNHLVEGLGGSR